MVTMVVRKIGNMPNLSALPTFLVLIVASGQSASNLHAQNQSARMPLDAITVELVAPSEAIAGTSIAGLDIVMTNNDSVPFHFASGADLFDLHVLDESGSVVWRYIGGGVLQSYLRYSTIGAHQSISLSDTAGRPAVLWNLRAGAGFSERTPLVEPGVYQVKGFVAIRVDSPTTGPEHLMLETSSRRIVIHEPSFGCVGKCP